MFLRGMIVKRACIPVNIRGVEFVEGEKERLLAKIKESNDPASKERLILGFIRLAIDVAARYASKFIKRSEALLSGSLYGLVWAVSKIQEKLKDDNVEKWITVCCHRFVYQALLEENRFRVGSRMCKKPIDVVTVPNGCSAKVTRLFDFNYTGERLTAHLSRLSILEIREIMDAVTKDETDRKILSLRLKGCKNVEIAERLGLSSKEICVRRSKMKRRYVRCRQEDV